MSKFAGTDRRGFFRSAAGASVALAGCSVGAGNKQKEPVQPVQKYTLAEKNRVRRDFSGDVRSHKVVFVPHCALNQNARITDAADFPAIFEPLMEALRENQVGIIQMPCPELRVLGLGRKTVRDGLETPEGQAHLKLLIEDLVYIIKEYQFQGFHVVGILGKNGSPSCGVTRTYLDGKQVDGEGVFIRELRLALAKENLDIELFGIVDHQQDEAVAWVLERI